MPQPRELPRVVLISQRGTNARTGSSALAKGLLEAWASDDVLQLTSEGEDPSGPSIRAHLLAKYSPLAVGRNIGSYARRESLTLDRQLSYRPTRSFYAQLEEFNPAVIYTHVGPPWMIRAALDLHAHLEIPIATHSLDDYLACWPATTEQRQRIPATRQLNKKINNLATELFAKASARFAISEMMADEYSGRFGQEFEFLPHAHVTSPVSRKRDTGRDGSTLLVFGGTVLPYTNLGALTEFAEGFLPLLQRSSESSTILRIFSNSRGAKRLSQIPFVEVREPIAPEAFLRQVALADFALMPLNQDRRSFSYTRLSWPTKLLDYFSAMTPVVYFGPNGTAVGDFVRRTKSGFFVDSSHRSSWESTAPLLFTPREQRKRAATAAAHLNAQLSAESARGRFEHRICAIRDLC